MTLGYALPLAAALLVTGITGAASQFPPQQQQMPPCANEFLPLRDEAQKRGNAIQAASKRKAPREEVCGLFKSFAEAEAKYVKYAETNATWCGIPAEAVQQMKSNHSQTLRIRGQVCAAAAAPAKPRGPTLGDALGTTAAPTPDRARTGRGTYDTLTGSPLTR